MNQRETILHHLADGQTEAHAIAKLLQIGSPRVRSALQKLKRQGLVVLQHIPSERGGIEAHWGLSDAGCELPRMAIGAQWAYVDLLPAVSSVFELGRTA